jgi:uncharacterized metal-binding protein YceD (DUF177 family)
MPSPLAQEPELSRPVQIDQIGADGVSMEIEADPTEREARARRFGLVRLDRLHASATVLPVSRKLFRVEASFEAEVVQTCVVTLDPFGTRVAERFTALFGEGGPGVAALVSSEEEDQPEPIEGNAIDLGEAVAQHLALALDPYPRRPGASIPAEYAPNPEDDGPGRAKPFAGLGVLKGSREP